MQVSQQYITIKKLFKDTLFITATKEITATAIKLIQLALYG